MTAAEIQSEECRDTSRFAIPSSWMKFIGDYGYTTFVSLGLMIYLAFFVVEPQRNDQKAFMQSVIKTNEINANTYVAAAQAMNQMTIVQQTQAATLTTLVDQQKQTTTILQQIRDDQRAGAWRDTKGHQ